MSLWVIQMIGVFARTNFWRTSKWSCESIKKQNKIKLRSIFPFNAMQRSESSFSSLQHLCISCLTTLDIQFYLSSSIRIFAFVTSTPFADIFPPSTHRQFIHHTNIYLIMPSCAPHVNGNQIHSAFRRDEAKYEQQIWLMAKAIKKNYLLNFRIFKSLLKFKGSFKKLKKKKPNIRCYKSCNLLCCN